MATLSGMANINSLILLKSLVLRLISWERQCFIGIFDYLTKQGNTNTLMQGWLKGGAVQRIF